MVYSGPPLARVGKARCHSLSGRNPATFKAAILNFSMPGWFSWRALNTKSKSKSKASNRWTGRDSALMIWASAGIWTVISSPLLSCRMPTPSEIRLNLSVKSMTNAPPRPIPAPRRQDCSLVACMTHAKVSTVGKGTASQAMVIGGVEPESYEASLSLLLPSLPALRLQLAPAAELRLLPSPCASLRPSWRGPQHASGVFRQSASRCRGAR